MKKNKVLLLTLMPLEPVKSGYQNTVFNLYNELKKKFIVECIHIKNINNIDPVYNLKYNHYYEEEIKKKISNLNLKYIFINTTKLFYTYENILLENSSKCVLICHDLYYFRKKYFSVHKFKDLTPITKTKEVKLLKNCKYIIDFSNSELNYMNNQNIDKNKMIKTMTPVNVTNYQVSLNKNYDFIFVGSSLKQNQISLINFFNKNHEFFTNKKVCIVGSKLSLKKIRYITYKKSLKTSYYRNSHIGIAPIYAGTGRNVKIFDMMANSLPVVTNIDLSAYGLQDGKHYIYVSTIKLWKNKLNIILSNHKLRNDISYNGWKWVSKNCKPSIAFKKLFIKLK